MSLTAAALASAQTGNDPWQTVGNPTYARDALVDSTGRLFVAGSEKNEDGSTNGGVSQIFRNTDPAVEMISSFANCTSVDALCAAPNGDLFAAGRDGDANRLVFRSADSGETWNEIARLPVPFSSLTRNHQAIAADNAGNVYLVGARTGQGYTYDRKGNVTGTTTTYPWIIFKGRPSDGAATGYAWETTEIPFAGVNQARAAHCMGSDLYVAGTANSNWEVRRFTNGNVSADPSTVIDRWQFKSGQPAGASGITADASGRLIVVGASQSSGLSTEHWTVRRGARTSTGSWTWTTLDRYSPTGYESAKAATVATGGDIFVVGYTTSSRRWLTRRLRTGSTTWTNSDAPYPSPQTSQANAVVSTTAGILTFGVGNGENVIRQLVVP